MREILNRQVRKNFEVYLFPVEEQERVVFQIGELIREGVVIRVMESLAVDDRASLEKLLTNAQTNEGLVIDFLKQKVGNIEEVIEEEIRLFKKESLEFMGLTSE